MGGPGGEGGGGGSINKERWAQRVWRKSPQLQSLENSDFVIYEPRQVSELQIEEKAGVIFGLECE